MSQNWASLNTSLQSIIFTSTAQAPQSRRDRKHSTKARGSQTHRHQQQAWRTIAISAIKHIPHDLNHIRPTEADTVACQINQVLYGNTDNQVSKCGRWNYWETIITAHTQVEQPNRVDRCIIDDLASVCMVLSQVSCYVLFVLSVAHEDDKLSRALADTEPVTAIACNPFQIASILVNHDAKLKAQDLKSGDVTEEVCLR